MIRCHRFPYISIRQSTKPVFGNNDTYFAPYVVTLVALPSEKQLPPTRRFLNNLERLFLLKDKLEKLFQAENLQSQVQGIKAKGDIASLIVTCTAAVSEYLQKQPAVIVARAFR